MEPIYLAQLNVIPMFSLYFKLPPNDYGRDDITVVIEYVRSDIQKNTVHCWAWAQVGDAFIRGKVDEFTVKYIDDKDKLDESIIRKLNGSKRFQESLPGFIESILRLDPGAAE